MRYLNYARRSSDESSKRQIQSIDDQLHDTRRIAAERGLNVLEELTESRSAKAPGRPVFNRLLSLIETGQADAILCWKLDRLTRNPIDAAALRWLMRQGKLLEIHTPRQIYRPEDNAIISAVENAMAEQYIIDLKKGVERGMTSKCEKGGFPLKAPAGYFNNRLTRSVEVDRERFALLRRAWELLIAGGHSVPQIHRTLLDTWGYRSRPTPQTPDGRLTLSALYKIFNNTFYKGSFSFQGRVYAHAFTRMVTPEEWDLAQRVLQGRGPKKPARYSHNFAGLMNCATCGFNITAEKSKGHTYYHCSNRLGLCTKKGIREEAIAAQIEGVLESITIEPEFEALAIEALEHLKQEGQQRQQDLEQRRRRSAESIQKQQEALLALYLQGHLTVEEFAAKKQELAQQAADLSGSVNEATNRVDETVREVVRYAANARTRFRSADGEVQRTIARHLGTYTFNNGELQIELHPLLEPVRANWKELGMYLEKVEPFKSGSGKGESAHSGVVFQRWCSQVEEYRTWVLESNLVWHEEQEPNFLDPLAMLFGPDAVF